MVRRGSPTKGAGKMLFWKAEEKQNVGRCEHQDQGSGHQESVLGHQKQVLPAHAFPAGLCYSPGRSVSTGFVLLLLLLGNANSAQDLLLVMHAGITLGWYWGTLWGSWD